MRGETTVGRWSGGFFHTEYWYGIWCFEYIKSIFQIYRLMENLNLLPKINKFEKKSEILVHTIVM